MPYIKKRVEAGRTCEIIKTHSFRYGKKNVQRQRNKNPTREKQKEINERNARDKLRWLINSNFGENDIHLVLTYRKEVRPDPEEAKHQLANFLRRLREHYKRDGTELKYIAVTEWKGRAIHHHLIINSTDVRQIIKLWKYGKMRPSYLDSTGQYGQLANYLIKETSKTFRAEDSQAGKRWQQSKNLKKPKITTEIVKAYSWKADPKPEKGYYVVPDSVVEGVNDVTGYPFQRYTMIKLE